MRDEEDLIGDATPPLSEVLREHLPQHRKPTGEISLSKIADAVGISRQATSLWVKKNAIVSIRVNQLIALPGSTLTKEILFPYVDFG